MADREKALVSTLVSLVNQREADAARVANLLHDQVAQVLSAVGLQLGVLRLDFEDRLPELKARTAEIQQMLEQAITQVRDVSYELNPAIVERAGLKFALDRLAGRFREKYDGTLRLLYDSTIHVPQPAANGFYRVAEYAIENSVKHAAATQIEVLLRATPKSFTLEVRDNGRGFDYDEVRTKGLSIGLLLMEHYARGAGLELEIESAVGKGTIVKTQSLR